VRFRIPDGELTWKFSPTGGPGGQHANKTSTRVELTFVISESAVFDESTRTRLLSNLGEEVRVIEDGSRSQATNRKRALRRLDAVLDEASRPDPPPRKQTKPSRRAKQKRLDDKKQRGEIKKKRKSPHVPEE
jgi:ribosome-associated protein